MKCKKCGSNHMYGDSDEMICDNCGAAYELVYLGYYPEGAEERIDEGFEDEKWLKAYGGKSNEHKNK